MKDKRVGKQVKKASPLCPNCKQGYMSKDYVPFSKLFVWECPVCNAFFENIEEELEGEE